MANTKLNRKYYLRRRVKTVCRLHKRSNIMYIGALAWGGVNERHRAYMLELRDKYQHSIQTEID